MKALETPEEKRARRLAKKQAKEIKKRKEMGWDDEELNYTNTDNPYGDTHLLETFIWHKKHEKEGTTHLSEAEKVRRNELKREEMKRELASVKRRRQEREQERMAREEEREMMQREKEGEYYKEWEKQEDMFHIEQARMRSKIRIRDGRAKPIDLLAQYVNPEEDSLEFQMHEPYSVLVGLSEDDLGDLIEDMKLYLEIDEGKNHQFWQDMLMVTRNEEKKLKKQNPHNDQFHERRETINASVNKDIEKIFRGKTSAQLSALRSQINQKISGGGTVDIGELKSNYSSVLGSTA